MSKLSISLVIPAFMVALASAVQAYATEPVPDTLQKIIEIKPRGPQNAQSEGACIIPDDETLAAILDLSDDWRDNNRRPVQNSFACAME